MFSNIRQGSPIYLLDKLGQNGPVLKIGQVEQVSPLQPKHQTFTPGVTIGLPNMNEMVINIKVKFDDGPRDFKEVPANLSLADFNNGTVISDNRADMISETEVMVQNSKQIIASEPYHHKVVQAGDTILKQLNPNFAKEVERDNQINDLTNKVDSLTDNVNTLVKLVLENGGKLSPGVK
jgi:hypothetical protein